MSWLYVPGLECLKKVSPPASGGSRRRDTGHQRPRFDLCVLSSGKSQLRPSSWSGWRNRASIIERLSGTTLPLSTVEHGAAAFIASLPVIPASPSARPDVDEEPRTSVTYGRTSLGSSRRPNRRKSSSRTSPGTCRWAFRRSAAAYKTWATALRRDCSARLKQARATRESVSLCWPVEATGSPNWPTPSARDWRPANTEDSQIRRGRTGQSGQQLPNHVAYFWPTPRASSGAKPSCGRQAKDCIAMQAQRWPTPQTHDIAVGNPSRVGAARGGGGCRNLTDEATAWNWPTPDSYSRGGAVDPQQRKAGNHSVNLQDRAAFWPTPRSCSGKGSSGAPRTAYYQSWGKAAAPDTVPQCRCHSTLLALLNTLRGPKSSDTRPILNPQFVEMLMGWPIGSTDSTASAMEWFRFRSLTHTALYTLPLLTRRSV